MTISEESLDMTEIPIWSLSESDKKQILMAQQTTVEQLSPGELDGHIVIRKPTDGPAHGLSPNSPPQASLARIFTPQNMHKDQKLNTKLPVRQETLPDLAAVMFYNESQIRHKKVCVKNSETVKNYEIDFILQRSSSYFRCRNILARIIQLKQRNKSMLELQNEAENKIFEEFQQQADY